jgi:hypothetical protein
MLSNKEEDKAFKDFKYLIGKGIREEEGTETRILNIDKYINKNVYKVKIFYKGKAEILIIEGVD